MDRAVAVSFRAIALIEALTWVGLLIGMLFKYVIDGSQLGVRIFGTLHGAAFLAYVPLTLLAARRFRWPLAIAALGIFAAFPPLCTVFFERWVARTGRLAAPSEATVDG